MKVLLTGATGFLGIHIGRQLLMRGHSLVILSRSEKSARERFPFPCKIFEWNPLAGPPPQEALDGVEGVIHLAGEPVAAERWSVEQKKRIMDSRVQSTRNLWQGIGKSSTLPHALISASAVGFYGDRGDELLTEASSSGFGFLSEVCQAWEKEIFAPVYDQVRVAAIRIGVVLGREGGALAKLLPIFKKGAGGPVGSGKQWMSWVHAEDLAALFVEALENKAYRGAVNGVAPHPVTNREFSKALGRVLRRPAILAVPAPVLKVALGEMSAVVLEGQRVKPEKALKNGFSYAYGSIEAALSSLCAPGGEPGLEEFSTEQWIDSPVDEIFPFFSAAKNLEAITPPWVGFQVRKISTPEIESGTLIDYTIKVHGVPMKWRTRIEDWEPNRSFVDTQIKGPYSRWHHTHTFVPMGGGTLMRDRVLYRLPLGALGKGLAHWKIRRDIESIFSYRKKRIQELFGA